MKSRILSVKTPVSAGLASAALLLAMTPAHAQEALIEKAKQACTDAALAKGFELKEVVSSESTADGGAKVVLDLTRNGASAKLTCNLSKEGNVISSNADTSSVTSSNTDTNANNVTGSDTTGNTTEPTAVVTGAMASAPVKTYPAWLNPWWGIIGSLVGLSLLLLLAKRLRETWYPTRWGKKASTLNIVRNSEVVVRHANHEGSDVRSGPSANYPVTRHLQNGNRVRLTGRQEDHWVELTDGGWLPTEHLELEPHLV